MKAGEAMKRATARALEIHGERTGTAALREFYLSREYFYRQTYRKRPLTEWEQDSDKYFADLAVSMITWGAKKIRSRAKKVKNLHAIVARYEQKFGECMFDAYRRHRRSLRRCSTATAKPGQRLQ